MSAGYLCLNIIKHLDVGFTLQTNVSCLMTSSGRCEATVTETPLSRKIKAFQEVPVFKGQSESPRMYSNSV